MWEVLIYYITSLYAFDTFCVLNFISFVAEPTEPREHRMPVSATSRKGSCLGWGLLSNYTAVHSETVSPVRWKRKQGRKVQASPQGLYWFTYGLMVWSKWLRKGTTEAWGGHWASWSELKEIKNYEGVPNFPLTSVGLFPTIFSTYVEGTDSVL